MAITLGTGTLALATLGVATTLLVSEHPESAPNGPADDLSPPAVPTGVYAELVDGSTHAVALSWDANQADPDLAGYIIYRSDRPDGGFRSISSQSVQTNHFVDSSAPSGQPCFYRVAARDASSNESGLSGLTNVHTLPSPEPTDASRTTLQAGF